MHQGESGRVASCCENAFAGWSDDMSLYSNTADTECTYPRFLGPERTAPSRGARLLAFFISLSVVLRVKTTPPSDVRGHVGAPEGKLR